MDMKPSEEQVPVGKVIHAIVDNYATHKHPKVRQWLARHPRWTPRELGEEAFDRVEPGCRGRGEVERLGLS
jgi:hypothetical protein